MAAAVVANEPDLQRPWTDRVEAVLVPLPWPTRRGRRPLLLSHVSDSLSHIGCAPRDTFNVRPPKNNGVHGAAALHLLGSGAMVASSSG